MWMVDGGWSTDSVPWSLIVIKPIRKLIRYATEIEYSMVVIPW